MQYFKTAKLSAVMSSAVLIAGCVPGSISDRLANSAELQPQTSTGMKLETLPPPKHPVMVSVYKIDDKTGQHKPNTSFAEYSRAVTQAGSAILIDVLKKTGFGDWFRVLERTALKNVVQERNIHDISQQARLQKRIPLRRLAEYDRLLSGHRHAESLQQRITRAKKRLLDAKAAENAAKLAAQSQNAGNDPTTQKIVNSQNTMISADRTAQAAKVDQDMITTSQNILLTRAAQRVQRAQQELTLATTRAAMAKAVAPKLKPLKWSKYIIEGAITGYDANMHTGGIGARYLGIGADKQFQRDIVTVTLRVVDVRSGEVLVSVTSTKTIFSIAIRGGVFKYVALDKLLEIEGGGSQNELATLAVRHAFELGVFSLIAEGEKIGLWKFKDPADGVRVLEHYDTRYTRTGKERHRNEVSAL